MNSAAMASIYFLLMNELVIKRGIGKLESMTDDREYFFALDLLNFVHG